MEIKINGLLIHDLGNTNKPQTYIAQHGEFIGLVMKRYSDYLMGIFKSLKAIKTKISEIEFETYDLNLTPYSKQEDSHIYSDELFTNQLFNNLEGKRIKELNKYEKEQFAELHSRFVNPLYIFSFALIPLIILKFSKKPGDNLLFPITIISTLAFFFQITQITLSNLLIENSNLVFVSYILPILIIILTIILILFDSFEIKGHINAK